jgi:hypothetical protein
LFFVPVEVAITATLTVQLLDAGIVPPLNVNVVSAGAGAKVGLPHPVVLAFGTAATCTPEGRASVNATPVRIVEAFGFVIVKLSVLVPATITDAGAKLFPIEGGPTTVTVSTIVEQLAGVALSHSW